MDLKIREIEIKISELRLEILKLKIKKIKSEISDLKENKENRTIESINEHIKIQEGMKEVLYGLKDNTNRNQDISVRARDNEMEQGHRGYSIGTDNTDGSSVEKLKQIARDKKERDREYKERIERENRKPLEQE